MTRIPQEVSPMLSLAEVNEEDAIIQCQLDLCRTNVKVLSESIINLSQEVEHALLRKKWSSQLTIDKGTENEQIRSPVEDALAICMELKTSPEYIEDISVAFKQRQASLQETIKALTKEIDDLKNT